MSNIGLNTNTYRVTGKYLDFLNDFIVKVKLHPNIIEEKKEQLIAFISKLNDTKNIEPQFQLLSSIIERELRNNNDRPNVFMNSLITAIQGNDVKNSLSKIEFIVGVLDNENSEALAKIKGE
jgi:hypothetical protein